MAKNKKMKTSSNNEEELEVTEVPTEIVVKPPVRKRAKTITFAQWIKMHGVKARHVAGMRAFVKNSENPRTVEEWDSIFAKY